MAELSDKAKALLERPIHGWVTTLDENGAPHSTVVWVGLDERGVYFNTAVGRVKEKNLRRDPRLSLGVLDPDDAYNLVSITGTAVLETEGADDVINGLAKKYMGVDEYPFRRPGEQRVTVRIQPERIIGG
jgi:PPOX class probable F420-dependent enzyme